MQKIDFETAKKYFCCNNQEVFLLYDDDTESAAYNLSEMEAHNENGGEFGIESDENILSN